MKLSDTIALSMVGAYVLFAKFPSVKNVAVFASEVDHEVITFAITRRDKNLHRLLYEAKWVERHWIYKESVAFYHYDVGFRDH